jgi:putative membrane protein
MFEQQLIKVAIGLAIIIPVILLLRWFLGKSVGSPEEWAEYHIQELERRYASGEIDEEAYQKRLEELKKR